MTTRLSFVLPLVAGSVVLALGSGCANKQTARPVDAPVSVTAAPLAPKSSANGNVFLGGDLARICNIQFASADRAPKFDFDRADVLPQDRDVLEQVARCLTTGPLKGHVVELVGRANPRGEVEYNMALGGHRAGAAETYLSQLGVPHGEMLATSRGKLDATGTDEAGWARDRRVDIVLP